MKFSTLSSFALASALVAASPLPAVELVTVTRYTTIQVNQAEYTAAVQKNTATTTSATTEAAAATTTSATTEAAAAVTTSATTEIAATTTSSTAETAAATTTSDSTATGETFSGEGTYYSTGLGACGVTSKDTDYIVALSHLLYDQYTPNGNPNKNTLCGDKINVHYGGKTVQVTVVDRCEACKINDLDLSPSAFTEIADQSLGRIDITWEWA